ncbi:guanine nucleotide-binding protein G(i) subunit alpha [Eurytemora carolleeae]|uniref:guanine nucleotide-binding protein G(i) subunit alpha n=1 Tax=Eurytemora carolleeae TaxID=1294199 RepID=UPI000C765ACB|nr:guanine nucleotide-binding protein G(i) subunit alpha [Eurytemora carolleeae]|eukprot:XP_023347454.1 guanine nucleotide-binding protein G(i) subunit alpha-like [Eurytemora affinis]
MTMTIMKSITMMILSAESLNQMRIFLEFYNDHEKTGIISNIPNQISELMYELWLDEGIQYCYKRRSEIQLISSCQYFLDRIIEISEPGYIPEHQDILRSRVQTTGVAEIKFSINKLEFNFFDVGGQRSQRLKWLRLFGMVDSVIFLVSRNTSLLNASIILFLNKIDVFHEKLKISPLRKTFPEYSGRRGSQDGLQFITMKFHSAFGRADDELYVHYTCATDTENAKVVFSCVKDTIEKHMLRAVGLF